MSFEVNAVIEIPSGSYYKYEINKLTGKLKVDRPLNQFCPTSYGYLPATLELDGDPLDVFVVNRNPIFPMVEVKVKIVGAFLCKDNGVEDNKLVGSLVGENNFANSYLSEIRSYLSSYKEGFEVGEYVDAEEAYRLVMKATQSYQETAET